MRHTEETKRKCGEASKRYWANMSEEEMERRRAWCRELRRRMAEKNKALGVPNNAYSSKSPREKQRIRRKMSETRKAMAAKMTQEERNAMISEACREGWKKITPERWAEIKRDVNKRHPELLKLYSEVQKRNWQNPEWRAHTIELLKARSMTPEAQLRLAQVRAKRYTSTDTVLRETNAVVNVRNDLTAKGEITPEVVAERQRVLQEQVNQLYNLAKRAMVGQVIEPEPNQTIDYYIELIQFFKPEWLEGLALS